MLIPQVILLRPQPWSPRAPQRREIPLPLPLSRLVLLAFGASLVLSGCRTESSTFGPAQRARDGNVFYLGGGSEPESIDPGKAYDSPGLGVTRNIFEGLMRYDPRTLDPLPGVAASYEKSEDGTHYLFLLRREARWSDGSPVTAHDFEWSWKRVLRPETAAQYAALLWDLKNGRAFAEGRVPEEAVGVKALDDHTLEVTLERPIPWFLEVLSFGPFTPVHRGAVEAHGTNWTRPENIVTNGPFHLSRWVISYQIELVKSETYWGKDEVSLDKAVFVISDDAHAMMRLFRAGELDWIGSDVAPPQEYLSFLKTKDDFHTSQSLATYYLIFNLREETPAQRASPLLDKRVRKALDMAVDKDAIVQFVTRGGQRAARSIVPDYFLERGYRPPPGNAYDPQGARDLLAAAGYGPGGKPFPVIEFTYNTNESHRQVAEAIQQMWRKELGIHVQLVNQEWKVFMSNRNEGYFQLSRAGWTGDFQDPYSFLALFLGDADMNASRWKNEEYDRLVDQALAEQDQQKRYELYARAEAILLDELPIIPIYFYSSNTLLGSWVGGYHPTPQNIHPLRDIRLLPQDRPVARETP